MELHGSAGNIFLVAVLIVAGIGAAVAPFFADLITAIAGVPVLYCLALALWAMARQAHGHTGTTKLLKAV